MIKVFFESLISTIKFSVAKVELKTSWNYVKPI